MFKGVELFGFPAESTDIASPAPDLTIAKLQDCLSSMDINLPTSVGPAPESQLVAAAQMATEVAGPSSFASTSSNVFASSSSSSTLLANHRRTLRQRSDSSGSLLHGVNRRTISRPRKLGVSPGSTELSEKDIIKLYLNQKLPRVKSTGLETIFEEAEDANTDDNSIVSTLESQFKLVGIKKKRSLSFSIDHSKANKTTVMKRRRRIKARLGTVKRGPKFSMKVFIEKMAALHNNETNDMSDCDSS